MINKKIIKLDEVDSTNNYARGILSKQNEEGTVVLAQEQTKGRGHGSNHWESEPRKNLLFSILLKPIFLNPGSQFFISMAVSLGIFDFISSEVDNVKIKWPNDIYVLEKKIGGILIENVIYGDKLGESIVGIGLNINQEEFFSDAPNAVSLKLLTGKKYNLDHCIEIIWSNIFNWYDILRSGNFKMISEAYISNLFQKGEWAKYKIKDKVFKGRIKGIDEFGQLKIEKEDKNILFFQFKEVQYIFTDRVG